MTVGKTCRTQLGKDIHDPKNPYNRVGRGNLAPVTINLVPMAIRNKNNPDGFFEEFKQMLLKAEESLLCRAKIIFAQKQKYSYEYYVNHLWTGDYEYDPEGSVYEILKHGTLAIGIIGWANALMHLFGEHHGKSPSAMEFVKKCSQCHNQFAKDATERNQLNFSAYATPAENSCHTLAKITNQRFGTNYEYLTNSYHLPVTYECSIFEKIDKESELAKYYTGGNIIYVELDTTANSNLKAVEQIIDYAMSKDVPYFAFNFPLDECLSCGTTGEFLDSICPECGSTNINKLRRVTGYISSSYVTAFNDGKIAETEERFKHSTKVEKIL